MSETLKYCHSLQTKMDSRFLNIIRPFGSDQLGKSVAKYDFNEGGFRSDPFIKLQPGQESILFSGCSLTFGFGLELEQTFAYKLYKYISAKKELPGFFNIAVPGSSGMQAILSIFDYINLYGNPTMIFLLMPQLERDAAYLLNYKFEIDYKNTRPKEKQSEDFDRYAPLFYRLYKTLYLYCKSNGIKLFSGHWHETDMVLHGERKLEDYSEFSLSYWLHQDFKDTYKDMMDKNFTLKMYDYSERNPHEKNMMIADDDDHAGAAWHNAVFETFIEKYDL